MTRLVTAVADLAGRIQWTTIGSGAFARNVALHAVSVCKRSFQQKPYQLATGIALLSLCLAIPGIMVGPSALVARGGPVLEPSTESWTEPSAGCRGTTTSTNAHLGSSSTVTL